MEFFFVSLGTIRDAALVPSTIIQALHLSEAIAEGDLGRQNIISHKAMLKEFLRDKGVLLVLDNVEQIPEMASFVSNLLSIISRLKILVTSRTILHLYGEHEFDVPPLEVYSPDISATLENILQCPAIRLFVERAQAVNASFRITEQNAATIAHICTRLDGLPLAIELAAVRTKVLPVSKILQRLAEGTGQSLTFLRTMTQNALQKHQTLYETLDWSYELLDQQQQKLFRRLSIFLGSWTLEAAQAVAIAKDQDATLDEILEQMEALINQPPQCHTYLSGCTCTYTRGNYSKSQLFTRRATPCTTDRESFYGCHRLTCIRLSTRSHSGNILYSTGM